MDLPDQIEEWERLAKDSALIGQDVVCCDTGSSWDDWVGTISRISLNDDQVIIESDGFDGEAFTFYLIEGYRLERLGEFLYYEMGTQFLVQIHAPVVSNWQVWKDVFDRHKTPFLTTGSMAAVWVIFWTTVWISSEPRKSLLDVIWGPPLLVVSWVPLLAAWIMAREVKWFADKRIAGVESVKK